MRKVASHRKQFVSEAITPIDASFATTYISIGEPGLPLRFRWRGQSYHIALIPSVGDLNELNDSTTGVRQIFVVNRPDWSSPPGAMVFDLATMQTPYVPDRIHTAFRIFMLRYYGVKFKDQGLA